MTDLVRLGDEYLATIGIKYTERWRDFGVFLAFTVFNAFLAFVRASFVFPTSILIVRSPSGMLLLFPCSQNYLPWQAEADALQTIHQKLTLRQLIHAFTQLYLEYIWHRLR